MKKIGIFSALAVGAFVLSGCATRQCPTTSSVDVPPGKFYVVKYNNQSPATEMKSIKIDGNWIRAEERERNNTYLINKESVREIVSVN